MRGDHRQGLMLAKCGGDSTDKRATQLRGRVATEALTREAQQSKVQARCTEARKPRAQEASPAAAKHPDKPATNDTSRANTTQAKQIFP